MDAAAYQAIVAAPGFALGIRDDGDVIVGIDFLEPGREQAARSDLAATAAAQLHAYLENPAFHFSLPLAPAGTVFQRRVWAAIAAIPPGETRTYGELAHVVATAPRALGNACGANPYPLVVPCHRVVASDGKLGGFARQRGGFLLDVKRWLLAHEGHG